jgi:hypothetical protein
MKTATTLAMAALMVTAGAALADQPVVLTDAQLDQVTAGDRHSAQDIVFTKYVDSSGTTIAINGQVQTGVDPDALGPLGFVKISVSARGNHSDFEFLRTLAER